MTPQTIQYNSASDYELDVTTFTAWLDACKNHRHHQFETCPACIARLEQAITLYQGDFLAGLSRRDSVAFDDWCVLNRERLHRLAVEILQHLVRYFQNRREFQPALEYAWQQVELDPWGEQARRRVMRLLNLTGQREAALAQYEICSQLLVEKLGIEPAEETTRLYEQIRSGAANVPHSWS